MCFQIIIACFPCVYFTTWYFQAELWAKIFNFSMFRLRGNRKMGKMVADSFLATQKTPLTQNFFKPILTARKRAPVSAAILNFKKRTRYSFLGPPKTPLPQLSSKSKKLFGVLKFKHFISKNRKKALKGSDLNALLGACWVPHRVPTHQIPTQSVAYLRRKKFKKKKCFNFAPYCIIAQCWVRQRGRSDYIFRKEWKSKFFNGKWREFSRR